MASKKHRIGIRTSLTEKYNSLKSQFENNSNPALYRLYALSMKSWESHEKRVAEMINEIGKYDLNLNERVALDNYLTTYTTNVMKNKKRIKNADSVVSATNSVYNLLYRRIENPELEIYEASKPMSLTERAIEKITNTDLPSGTPRLLEYSEPEDIENVVRPDFASYSKTRPEKISSFWKKAGNILTYTAIGVAGAAILGFSSFFGGKYVERKFQQEIINSQNSEITDYKTKLESAGNSDAEVRKEAIAETNCELTTKYEEIIEFVKQEAREQAKVLLNQQKSLEEKLVAAGRIDEEVRKEAKENMVEKENYLTEERKTNISSEASIDNSLPNKEAVVNLIVGNKTTILEDTNSISIVSDDTNTCNELEIQKQQYLIDKPWDYPKRLDERCKQLNKNGKHLEDAITRVGWVAAVGNDALEGPIRFISGLGGGIWGAGSRLVGNKNDGFDNGWKNGDQFGAYVMDGFYGGITKTEFDGRLLSLDLEGALLIPYYMEDTKLGGHGKLAQVIWWDFVAPFVANNNLSNGGKGHHPVNQVIEEVTGGRTPGRVGLR